MTRFELLNQVREAAIKPTARAVGYEIAAHWNDETEMARISAKEIGERIGRKDRQVREAINELVDAGIIVKVKTKRASIYKSNPKISSLNRVNAPAENRRSWTLNAKGLNPQWRQILPEFADMSDDEVAEEFRKLTVAAKNANETGWTIEECERLHPDWIQAQISTVRACGINGSRFLEDCPLSESTESVGERYTKQWEMVLGF